MLKRISFAKVFVFNRNVPARNLETSGLEILRREVGKFDPKTRIEAAVTPPSVWFSDALFHQLDKVTETRIDSAKVTSSNEAPSDVNTTFDGNTYPG